MPVPSSMNYLCKECLGSLKETDMKCPVCCGLVQDGGCSICGNRMFYPERNISLFSYNNTAKSVIYALKFGGVKNIHRIFIPYICRVIKDLNVRFDLITFVPMNRKKLIKRGYNQSKLLAGGVAEKTGIRFCEILKEKKNTVSQRDLNYSGRFINVIDRYKTVNKNIFYKKNILLIDDVFTTGATINECSRILISSGAAKVYSVTLVRSDLKKLEII